LKTPRPAKGGGRLRVGWAGGEGHWLGAEVFVSFDRKAVKLIESAGAAARLLSS
jgi:hypothetical protein